jgi:hypothetical protein
VAVVDDRTGALRSSANLRGGPSPLALDVHAARAAAGADPSAAAELVWQPSRASQSPLYPVWEVVTHDGAVYVDQQGQVHARLDPGGPGGAID